MDANEDPDWEAEAQAGEAEEKRIAFWLRAVACNEKILKAKLRIGLKFYKNTITSLIIIRAPPTKMLILCLESLSNNFFVYSLHHPNKLFSSIYRLASWTSTLTISLCGT